MAKKEETISLLDTFQEFKESKNIDRTTMISVLEESFRKVIVNLFGTDENYSVIVNPDRGDFEIQRRRVVVADKDVQDSNFEISLSEAQLIDDTFEEGEEVSEIVNFAEFGRRAILNLRQTLASKILELEKDSLYHKYSERIGQIVSAEVYQIWKKELLLVDDEGNEVEGEPVDTQVFCNVRSVGFETWATAAQLGLKPELQVEVRTVDYAGQSQAVFNGREYDLSYSTTRGDNTILTYATHARNDNG